MAISRTIYTVGTVKVNGTELFAQSASFSEAKPKESISAFGRTSVQRVSSGPETTTFEVTFYPTGGEGGLLQGLMTDTAAQTPTRCSVVSNIGTLAEALLMSIKGDASIGSVPTVTASFLGLASGNAADAVPSSAAITTIRTTEQVSINGAGCAQKASFSWDMPVEPITCLGRSIASGAEFFGNPPGTASINAEGTTSPGAVTTLDIGNFTFTLGSGSSVSSSTVNLAVGQMHGTFNTVTEGIAINSTIADS